MDKHAHDYVHSLMVRAGWMPITKADGELIMWRVSDRALLSARDVEDEIIESGTIIRLLSIPENPDLSYKVVRSAIMADMIKCGCCDNWFDTSPGKLPPFWNYYPPEKILICPACSLNERFRKFGKGEPIFITPNVMWQSESHGHEVPCAGCEYAIDDSFPGVMHITSHDQFNGQLPLGDTIPICAARIIGTVESISHLISIDNICDIRHLMVFSCKRGYWLAVTKE